MMQKLESLKFDKLLKHLDELFYLKEKKLFYHLPLSFDILCKALKIDVLKNQKILKKFIFNKELDIYKRLDEEVMQNFLLEKGYDFKKVVFPTFYEKLQFFAFENKLPEKKFDRNLVVTVMGHVDHGKTTLLDVIRNTNVANDEAGKITQKIGGYEIVFDKQRLTFIDTPGHNLFSKMRRQGVDITDIVILVVSGVEGVKKQTIEAIQYIQKTNIPIIVFINKNDLPQYNATLVKQRLTDYNLVAKEWGGKTIFIEGSCHTKKGVDNLLKEIVAYAKKCPLQVNLNALSKGVVIDSYFDRQGIKTSIILQKGILKIKDFIFVGNSKGKVRALFDSQGKNLNEVTPGMCVLLLGLDKVVKSGDLLFSFPSEKLVANLSKNFVYQTKNIEQNLDKTYFEKFWDTDKKNEQINIIIKFNNRGIEEIFQTHLSKLKTLNKGEKWSLNFISVGIGELSLNDFNLALLSKAHLVTFGLKINKKLLQKIKKDHLPFHNFNVLHKLFEFLNDLKMEKKLQETVVLGKAKVLRVFHHSKFGTIAGCVVLNGKITLDRKNKFQVLREKEMIATNLNVKSLKHEKDDIVSAFQNQEFGIIFDKFKLFKKNDLILQYQIKKINEV